METPQELAKEEQKNLEERTEPIELEIKAGLEGENSDVYAWINSPLPKLVKSVDDPRYAVPSRIALEATKEIARQGKKDITVKMSIKTTMPPIHVYSVELSHHSTPFHNIDINFDLTAKNIGEAREIIENKYPATDYQIIRIRPIR